MADSPHFVKYAHAVIRVRLFAGLRERAGWSERELDGVERVADVWPALGLGDEPRGSALRRQPRVRRARPGARRRRRGRADPAGLRRRLPGDRGAALARGRGRRGRRRARGRDRHLHRHGAPPVTRPRGDAPRVRGLRRDGRGRDGAARARAARSATSSARSRSTTASAGSGSARRASSIAVSAPHRQDALAACKDAIDTLKETVPLWKKEVYEGGEEWIGRGS